MYKKYLSNVYLQIEADIAVDYGAGSTQHFRLIYLRQGGFTTSIQGGELASHLRRSIKPRIKQRNLSVRPLADIPWDLGNVAEEIAADIVLVKLCAVHHASGAGNKIQGAL